MSRKTVILGHKVIDTGDMSGNLTGLETNVTQLDNIGYIAEWSGTSPVGVLSVEVQSGPSGWAALDFGSPLAVSGSSGSLIINVNQLPFEKIRVVYTATSGTGDLTVTLSSKVVGA